MDSLGYNNPMVQLQAQAMGNALPTGQGIRTAFHGGGQQPASKRSRIEENLYLPTGGLSSYANSGIGNTGLGMGGVPNQLGLSGAAGIGGAGLGLGQAQLQQQSFSAAGSNMGLSMGMGLSAGMVGGSGGMPITNINYLQGNTSANPYGAPLQTVDKEALEQQMTAERRLRNREHAKRSRVRKKFMLESLQEQVRKLQEENSDLRLLVQKHIPDNALKIIDDCCTSCPLFGVELDGSADKSSDADKKSDQTALIKTDFSLIESLTSGQQNFVLSDPRLPDNPIVFATPGFYELTGYTRDQVLGRNCRFLQGPGTDPKAVDVIRSAIANGNDATVCLLNYKADGTPFWNQFFVAALRDADNCIVNYVSHLPLP
jgi:PAS domain S-box-containing protein